MDTTVFIVLAILIIALVIVFFLRSNKKNIGENSVADYLPQEKKQEKKEKEEINKKEEKQPEETPKEIKNPENEIKNDKIVIVEGANYLNIKKAVQQFHDAYKKDNSSNPVIRLSKFGEDKTVLTFPNDIEFFTFCSLINYLYYPTDIFYSADIKGWMTIERKDNFIEPEIINKYVMLFIPFDDNEYDNVFFVTEDNKGYKLNLSDRNPVKLNTAVQHFVENKFGTEEAGYKPVEEIG